MVELPNRLKKLYARAATDPAFARKLLLEYFDYVGPDADRESGHADVLKATCELLSFHQNGCT